MSDSVPDLTFQSATLGAVVAGRYRLNRLLGEGGMGQVFEAEHLALGRLFALKVLRIERWSEELVARFNREARALARISSPRVAQVTDYGVEPSIGPYYVMELVPGETLEKRIERASHLPVDEALHVAAETCEALAEVHDAGIVHRDVKPSNIGLPPTGPVAVKLLDFGLAASVDDSFMQRITQSQQVLGSLPYMAPEQFHGARPIPQMDMYATGVALFEMLAGRLPFKAPSTAALIHQILASPVPSFTQVCPTLGIHPRVEQVVRRLLAKNPSDRFQSAREAAEAIRATAERSLATTMPGKVQLPPSTLGTIEAGGAMAETVSVTSDVVSADVSAETSRSDDWSSGQVVPPTSYPTPARTEPKRAPTRSIVLLAGGIAIGALAAVGLVLAISPEDEAEADEVRAAGAVPAESVAADPVAIEAAAPPRATAPDAGAPTATETETETETDRGSRSTDRGSRSTDRGSRITDRGSHRSAATPSERVTMQPDPDTMRGSTWSGEVIEEPEF